jgi:uncharacterized membrane protein YheB (UPF0754 family)
MAIDTMVNNPRTMVDIFRASGGRELSFIQHVGAVMGFILGLIQVVLYYYVTAAWADYVILPVSGVIIGFFTNWLALWMTFRPIWPHHFCYGFCNFQGVFLKRQTAAAMQISKLITDKVVYTKAMIEYILKNGNGADALLDIYVRHIGRTVDDSMGSLRRFVPQFIKDSIEDAKKDVINISLSVLPEYTDDIADYVEQKMDINAILGRRLAGLEPDKFEQIIHPIFKEDEWILLLVGAVLGLLMGLAQAYALQKIGA